MKHILIFAAAMAEELQPKETEPTPLEAAHTPNMDSLAQSAEVGLVRTIPAKLPVDSRIALLSTLGYAPEKYCTQGIAERLDPLRQLYGFSGSLISAEKELQDLAEAASLHYISVEKKKETIEEGYQHKVQASLQALADGYTLLCIHLSEAAKAQCRREKISCIEAMDRDFLQPLLQELNAQNTPYSLLLTAGYAASSGKNVPSRAAVPFFIYRSGRDGSPSTPSFNEKAAAESGLFLSAGPMLMQRFSGKYQCDFQFDCIPGL